MVQILKLPRKGTYNSHEKVWLLKYNGFLSYNGYNGFLVFLTVFRHVWGRKKLGCHHVYGVLRGGALWGHDNELSTKFWGSWQAYICCSSFITVFSYFVPAKTRLGGPPKLLIPHKLKKQMRRTLWLRLWMEGWGRTNGQDEGERFK